MRTRVAMIVLAVALPLFNAGGAERPQEKPYKGAEIYSRETVKHGRFEMRMRAVRASGVLATFFTYKQGSEQPENTWEEIDIEIFGKDDALGWQSNIIVGKPRRFDEAHHTASMSLADAYHTFALEWTPEYVAWFLDGKEVRRAEGDSVRALVSEQSLRFNIWPASIEDWAGPFEADRLPVYQYVNWIRFYRYEDGAFIHEWTDDFDRFDETRWARADWTFGENMADFAPENVTVRDGTLVLALTHADQVGTFEPVPPDDTRDDETPTDR